MVYTAKLTAFRMTKCQLCFMAKKTIFTKTSFIVCWELWGSL